MKKIFLSLNLALLLSGAAMAQDDVYPTKPQTGTIFITNGTVHIGNGQVVNNGTIEITNGKIVSVKENGVPTAGAQVVDAKGKQVYPGLILSVSDLGLKEIGSGVRGTNDNVEIGEFNSNVRSIVAYNTDSKVINTLKAQGILFAGVTPEGGVISGSSSVVQLDAWNWEDATYSMDNAMHMDMPTLISRPTRRGGGGFPGGPNAGGMGGERMDPLKLGLEKIEKIKEFFRDAKAYLDQPVHQDANLKYLAMKPLFEKKQKLFVHCDQVKQMLEAINFSKEFGFDIVIVGGTESWQIASILKQNNISVILQERFALPTTEDEDIDQPFKTPAMLHKAGVIFSLNDNSGNTKYRNLAFNAGIAAANGLGKEAALQAITLNAAKILGVDDRTGSIEAGKDANIVISEGDILDMRTSIVTKAFIQGRDVDLNNKQKQLYDRYKGKYEKVKPF